MLYTLVYNAGSYLLVLEKKLCRSHCLLFPPAHIHLLLTSSWFESTSGFSPSLSRSVLSLGKTLHVCRDPLCCRGSTDLSQVFCHLIWKTLYMRCAVGFCMHIILSVSLLTSKNDVTETSRCNLTPLAVITIVQALKRKLVAISCIYKCQYFKHFSCRRSKNIWEPKKLFLKGSTPAMVTEAPPPWLAETRGRRRALVRHRKRACVYKESSLGSFS